jgi:hypothetical protein
MKKLMRSMMFSCKKAAGLIENSTHIQLRFIERVKLSIHLRLCKTCCAYKTGNEQLTNLIEKHIQSQQSYSDACLSRKSKEEIINKIKKK